MKSRMTVLGMTSMALFMATGAHAAPRETVVAPATINVYGSDEVFGGEPNPRNSAWTFTLAPGYQVARLRLNAQVVVTDLPFNFAAGLTAIITPPGGTPVSTGLLPDTSQPAGTVLRTNIMRLLPSGPYPSGGEWSIKLIDSFASDPAGEAVEMVVTGLEVTAEDPVIAEPAGLIDLSAITDSRQINGGISPFGVQWYKFTTDRVDSADNQFLDIFVRPESSDNLMLILCAANGFPEEFDTFRGVGSRGLLSFGTGGGVMSSPTAIGTSDLRAGTYYLGVVRQPAFENIYNPLSQEFNPFNVFCYLPGPASSYTIQFNKGSSTPVPPTTTETFSLSPVAVTREIPLNADEVKWHLLDTTGTNIAPETSHYLDIAISTTDAQAPAVALYTLDGTLLKRGSSTTNGTETRETISLGVGSGLPLGRFLDVDPIFGGGAERTHASAGQSGSLIGGIYYLAITNSFNGPPRDGFRVYSDPEEPTPDATLTLTLKSGTRGATPPTNTNLGPITGEIIQSLPVNSGQTRWYSFQISAEATRLNARYLDIRTVGAERDTYIAVFNANGDVVAADEADGEGTNAWLSFGAGASNSFGDQPLAAGRDGDLAAGTYYVAIMPGQSNAGRRFTATPMVDDINAASSLIITGGTRAALPPPASTDIGVIASTITTQAVTVPEASITWLRFTLTSPVTAASGRYLEVVSTTLDGEEIRFPSIGLFDANGAFRANVPPLTSTRLRAVFGAGPHFTVASGQPLWWNPLGDLPAGEYYLGIAAGEVAWSSQFEFAPAPLNPGGQVTLFLNEGERAPLTPPPATDLGTITGGTRTVLSQITNTPVNWFTLTIPQDANDTTGKWLDIDTTGTSADGGGRNCAAMALYTTDGRLVARQGFNTFDFKAAFSFGASSPLRPLDGTFLIDDVARGQSGSLAAGTYLLGVTQLGIFFEDGFEFRQRSTLDVGSTVKLHIRSNFPGARCSPSDIAYGDGEPLPPIGQPSGFNPVGPDGGDFDCFFNFYFSPSPENAVCDIAYGEGEPLPPFGVPFGFNPGVDGGDFDCFFNYYFNGCL